MGIVGTEAHFIVHELQRSPYAVERTRPAEWSFNRFRKSPIVPV
jgi:hypothetical protein